MQGCVYMLQDEVLYIHWNIDESPFLIWSILPLRLVIAERQSLRHSSRTLSHSLPQPDKITTYTPFLIFILFLSFFNKRTPISFPPTHIYTLSRELALAIAISFLSMAGVSENNNAQFGAVVRSNRVVLANPSRPNHEPGSAAAHRAARAAKTARLTESRRRRYLRIARDISLVFQPRPHRPPRIPIMPPPSPPPRILNQLEMRFLFEKQLQNSDVGQAGRIVIPKREAEMHLPALEAKEGFWMHLDDMDFLQNWTIKFRYWPNNTSRMYVFENTRDFIAGHGLGFGDYIMVFKDDKNGSYLIRAKKNVVQVAADENNNLVSNAANHIPGIMDEIGSPLYHGDSSHLFDTSMDFFGGALDQPAFTQHQRTPSFESINFSLFG